MSLLIAITTSQYTAQKKSDYRAQTIAGTQWFERGNYPALTNLIL